LDQKEKDLEGVKKKILNSQSDEERKPLLEDQTKLLQAINTERNALTRADFAKNFPKIQALHVGDKSEAVYLLANYLKNLGFQLPQETQVALTEAALTRPGDKTGQILSIKMDQGLADLLDKAYHLKEPGHKPGIIQ